MLVLGLASVPLLAGVHHLPAGLPIAYSLNYLLSVMKTRRQDTTSVLKAALANLILAAFCMAVSNGTTFGDRCCMPYLFSMRVTLLLLNCTSKSCLVLAAISAALVHSGSCAAIKTCCTAAAVAL